MKENRQNREKVTAALRRAAEMYTKRGAPGVIHQKMEEWAADKAEAEEDAEDAPPFDTLRKWLAESPSIISAKHINFVEEFLREKYRHSLLTPTDNLDLQREIRGFFGQRRTIFNREKNALSGSWVMYRKLSTPDEQFLASRLTISEGEAGILIARDEVLIDSDEDSQGWIEETWDGFLVTTGAFYYFVLRMPDLHEARVSNAKFILLDTKEHKNETAEDADSLYLRMHGQTLIGVSRIGESDMFETVLQRTDSYEKEPFGVIKYEKIPRDIRHRFKQRERKKRNNKIIS